MVSFPSVKWAISRFARPSPLVVKPIIFPRIWMWVLFDAISAIL